VTNCQCFVFSKIKFLLQIRQVRKRGFGIDLGTWLELQRLWKKQPRKDGEFCLSDKLKKSENGEAHSFKNSPLRRQREELNEII
jgi:hypothetical protein